MGEQTRVAQHAGVRAAARFAVAAVWSPLLESSPRDERAECLAIFALRQARAALTAPAEAVGTAAQERGDEPALDTIILCNTTRLHTATAQLYSSHGIRVIGAQHAAAMQKYADKRLQAAQLRGARALNSPTVPRTVVHVLKLAAMWELARAGYAGFVLIDTDLLFHGIGAPLDLLSPVRAAVSSGQRTRLWTHPGQNSPINAGLLASTSDPAWYPLFEQAVEAGFDCDRGWGGQYPPDALDLLRNYSTPYVTKSLPAKRRQALLAGTLDDFKPSCINGSAPWCFIGTHSSPHPGATTRQVL